MPPKQDIESPTEKHVDSNSDDNATGHHETSDRRPSAAALLKNPLMGMSRKDILTDVDAFVDGHGLTEFREEFRKGALVAQVSNVSQGFEAISELSEVEKTILRRETTNKWSQPFMLYFLCTLCAGSAIVQGMDQTAVNGAQVCLLTRSRQKSTGQTDNPGLLLRDLQH